MLLAVVELPQLPLLLLLKIHVRNKSCVEAVAASVGVIVCRMTSPVDVVYCTCLFSILFKHGLFTIYPLAVSSHVHLDLPIILQSPCISCSLEKYGHARSQGGRQPESVMPPWNFEKYSGPLVNDTSFAPGDSPRPL